MRVSLLGVVLDPSTIDELNALIEELIQADTSGIIANHNLHSVYLFHHDVRMREFYARAVKIHIDSMALIMLGRLFANRLQRGHRVTYLDWLYPLMDQAVRRGWRVFYLGGRPGIAAEAARRLREAHPGLVLQTHHGYFDPSGPENARILELIENFRPNILMVGLGMPLQEHWILDNAGAIRANAILTSGACFDYIAGAIPSPPRWLGPLGLEWAFRFASEPRRLWRRYLVEPWFILSLIVKELVR